jgi:hypothetical protein
VTLRKSFRPITIAEQVFCSCDHENTSGGVRVGFETILLIVILTFAGGYVLHRRGTRRDRSRADRSRNEWDKRLNSRRSGGAGD